MIGTATHLNLDPERLLPTQSDGPPTKVAPATSSPICYSQDSSSTFGCSVHSRPGRSPGRRNGQSLVEEAGLRFHSELMWSTLRPVLRHNAELTAGGSRPRRDVPSDATGSGAAWNALLHFVSKLIKVSAVPHSPDDDVQVRSSAR